MSYSAIVTSTKKPNTELAQKVSRLFTDEGNVYGISFLYCVKEVSEALNGGVDKAKKELDNLMKGWKAANDEVSFGIHGEVKDFEFWYQRNYDQA